MGAWDPVLRGFETFVLVYFSTLALVYAASALLGLRAIVIYSREMSPVALKDLVERDFYKPVSILVPAYNEEDTIVHNLRSLLALHHPQFEVICSVDGATDATLECLVEAFALREEPEVFRRSVETQPVRRVLRSRQYANLVIVDKDNGGRADAINAALNLAGFPLVCVIDADSLLNPEALARASRIFVEDDTVIGVGGTLRPLNGAVVQDGAVVDLGAPRNWIERVQVLEYARSFFISRAAWSRLGCLMIISGAFGLFRREAVVEVGGWGRGLVADDMEMVIKLHRHFREQRQKYRIVFTPDPLCWTEVPETFGELRAQRNMWERGTLEVLWRHKRMLFNPRYGLVGMVGVPYLWIFEAGAAFVETLGYLYVVLAAIFGFLNVGFLLLFLTLAFVYGALMSELGMGIETLLLTRYERARDRLLLMLAAFVEYLGMRQAIVVNRAIAIFQVRRKRGRYPTKTGRQQPTLPVRAVVTSAEDADLVLR